MSSTQASQREGSIRQAWQRWLWPRIREYGESFISGTWLAAKALPWLVLWLTLPALCYWWILGQQAVVPVQELPYRVIVRATKVISDTTGNLSLVVAYPENVRLDTDTGQPMAIWLLRNQVASSSTTTPLLTPSHTFTPSNIVSPISTPTPTSDIRIIYLEATQNVLVLTDKERVPIPSGVAVTPASYQATPAVAYLYPAVTEADSLPSHAVLKAFVVKPGEPPLGATSPLEIRLRLESVAETQKRRQWTLLGGTTTAVVALATGLLGFAVQQWGQWMEQKQKAQEVRLAAIAEIDSLGSLSLGEPMELVQKYQEYQRKIESVWRDARIRAHLEVVWQGVASVSLRRGLDLIVTYRSNEGEWIKAVEFLTGTAEMVTWLAWCYCHLDERYRQDVIAMLVQLCTPSHVSLLCKLVKQPENRRLLREPAIIEALKKLRADDKVGTIVVELLAVRDRPPFRQIFWKSRRPADSRVIEAGLRRMSCSLNPFGPERAEYDPMLADRYGVPSPVSEEILGPCSVLAYGKSGAGKTASALFLAQGAQMEKAFAIYYTPRLELSSSVAGLVHLEAIAQKIARDLLLWLGADPDGFLGHDLLHKTAIGRLLTWHAGKAGGLALCLRMAGLSLEGAGAKVLRQIEGLAPQNSSHDRLEETMLVDLLGKARPPGLSHIYVVADLDVSLCEDKADEKTAGYRTGIDRIIHSIVSPRENAANEAAVMATSIQPLLNLTRLLEENQVFIKAFLPQMLRRHLQGNPLLKSLSLEWDQARLKGMLESRLGAAGISTLEDWCNREAKDTDPVRRFLRAAEGNPRQLVRLGNALLARIGARVGDDDPRLTSVDLQEIFHD